MASSHTLTLYPAIDLKDGACVRLRRGEMADATVYSDDPGAQARAWGDAGFAWLHVVDLNGAFAGRSQNEAAVRQILAAATVPVQLGGGLRDMKGVARWLEAGVARVILGSAAVQINVAVNSNFATGIVDPISGQNGPVSWLLYAFRFMQLPLGIFGVAIASATLPSISRSAAAWRSRSGG